MDEARAKRMTQELIGTSLGGWLLEEFIDNGKSALVFRASRGTEQAALKVFDPEQIERFGRQKQESRIQRELALRGKRHPNLVPILDGGSSVENGLFFIVMGLVAAPNLASVLSLVPRDRIWPIVAKIADAARFLEDLDPPLVHRDIKPENIALGSDFDEPVLLDLGVVRPIGLGDITDNTNARPFLGTLRYSSPEFLVRQEDDSKEGWRALTYYQLGAVLHDLIMRRPLFGEVGEPYALLVEAVRFKIPVIEAADVSPDLVLLAQHCLVKDPDLRLQLVSWEQFRPRASEFSQTLGAKERIEKRLLARQRPGSIAESTAEIAVRENQRTLAEISRRLLDLVQGVCTGNRLFPPLESHCIVVSDSCADLVLCFNRSASLELTAYPFQRIRLSLLDQPARVVELRCVAGLLASFTSNDAGADQTAKIVFKGVFQEEPVADILRQMLYTLIDYSQQLCTSPSSSEVLRTRGAIWIPEILPDWGTP